MAAAAPAPAADVGKVSPAIRAGESNTLELCGNTLLPAAPSAGAAAMSLFRFLPHAVPIAEYDELRVLPDPVMVKGTVVKGFGRGSKELGIPTANLDPEALGDAALTALPPGVYFGWASVGDSPAAHKMVMSIGWCVIKDADSQASAFAAPLRPAVLPLACCGRPRFRSRWLHSL